MKREPPAQCKICLKMFCRESVMKLHLKTHNIDRHYFECDICGKRITSKPRFIEHFRAVHCDDKPYACKSCPKKFGVKKSLQKHSKTHTAPRKFKCHVCLKAFMEKAVLKSHMQKHMRQPVACKLCGRTFETQNWLNFHLKFTNHDKTYTCDICGKAIKGKNSLKYHFSTHRTEKNFDCAICLRKFRTVKLLQKHIQRLNHTDSANIKFKCSFCPEFFTTKDGLDEHFHIHFDGTYYKCHICPKKYTRSNKLKPHLMDNHFEPITRFQCQLCSEVFKYEVTLKSHLANHISTPAVVYNCAQCTKKFSKATDFHVHEISHKPLLKCDYCYRSFKLPIFMDKHLEIHDEILYKNDDKSTGPQEYSCDLCSAVVSTKIGIWKHLKSHTQSLQCEFCSKSFDKFEPKFRSHLQMHITKAMQTHKNYQCEHCQLEFVGKATLEDHVLKYHKSKLYKGKYCTTQFSNRFRWATHNKEHVNKQRKECKECSKCIPANDYTKHERLHAEGKQPYSKYIATFWTCNLCDKNMIATNIDLRNHLANDHQMAFPMDPSKWKCGVCGDEMFVWGLVKHLRKVHGQKFLQATKKWRCIDCSIDCLSYGGVHKHMKKFHAERMYK